MEHAWRVVANPGDYPPLEVREVQRFLATQILNFRMIVLFDSGMAEELDRIFMGIYHLGIKPHPEAKYMSPHRN